MFEIKYMQFFLLFTLKNQVLDPHSFSYPGTQCKNGSVLHLLSKPIENHTVTLLAQLLKFLSQAILVAKYVGNLLAKYFSVQCGNQ